MDIFFTTKQYIIYLYNSYLEFLGRFDYYFVDHPTSLMKISVFCESSKNVNVKNG